MRTFSLILASLLVVSHVAPRAAEGGEPNVILITLDGVRWQEIVQGSDPELDRGNPVSVLMPFLMETLLPRGVFFGDHRRGLGMTISNPDGISLPAYQSLFAGVTTECHTNQCGRTNHETLQERLVRELGVPRLKVATIASWDQIPNAAERIAGATFVNAAFEPLVDGTSDSELAGLNSLQEGDRPLWGAARADRYTMGHARRYLRVHRPRFLYISLNDSDEWGHRGDYPRYLGSIRNYDRWIAELVAQLDDMGEYGRDTTLIVTTDHGRGFGREWAHHGAVDGSRDVWLFARSPLTRSTCQASKGGYRHIDIRPTIEAAFGLKPLTGPGRGQVIREIVQ